MKFLTILSGVFLTASIASAEVLVTVNGTDITRKMVNETLMQATQGRLNQVPQDKLQELGEQVLNNLVQEELIYGDAKKTGILKSKEFKEAYKKSLERIKKMIAIQVWQKKQIDKITIPQKELKKYYDSNVGEFKQPTSVHARHILVKTLDEAQSIAGSLKGLKGKALQTKFIALAKEKSEGPSSKSGGDLGYFPKGRMVPEFDSKVFDMKVGTISNPVKTQFGYHIIYLEDKQKAKTSSFKEVKEFIKDRLTREKFNQNMAKTIKDLHSKAKITNN